MEKLQLSHDVSRVDVKYVDNQCIGHFIHRDSTKTKFIVDSQGGVKVWGNSPRYVNFVTPKINEISLFMCEV